MRDILIKYYYELCDDDEVAFSTTFSSTCEYFLKTYYSSEFYNYTLCIYFVYTYKKL